MHDLAVRPCVAQDRRRSRETRFDVHLVKRVDDRTPGSLA